MEVTLVHPDAKESKVLATHPIQVAAFRGQGFVEESELATLVAESESKDPGSDSDELAKLKAENKALKSENTKLKNKLNDKGNSSESDEPAADPEGDKPEGDEKEETK